MFFSLFSQPLPVSGRLLLVSALAAGFSTSAWAEPESNDSLKPIVVTASRIEQAQQDTIPHTTVITSEMIRNKQASDLPTLLRNEAGIEFIQSGGRGTQTSLFMRGANANQVLILLDGIPLRDSTSTGSPVELQHILPDQIDRIEIVRGNVSAIYGSGAIGGVIQIFTKRGDGKPGGSATMEVGSDRTLKVSAGVSGKVDGTRYALSATRYKTDGFSAMNTSQYPNENPDNDANRNVSVSGQLSNEWSQGNEVGARVYAFDAKNYYDGGGTPVSQEYGKSQEWTLAAYTKNRITSDWSSTVTASQTQIHRRDYSYNGSWGDSESDFKSETSMFQWTNKVALSADWVLTAGADLSHEKADIGDPGVHSRNNQSLYAGVNGKIGAHSLQLNARYDHVGNAGSDTTGYIGYGYDLTSSWKLIASASTAFLAPTLYQMYYENPAWFISANPGLKVERSHTYEAGIQYASGRTLIRATLFDTRTRDLINYGTTGFENIGRAKNQGFELSAQSRLYGVDLRGSLTLQNPKNRDTDEQLLRRAKQMASLEVSKDFGNWHIGGDIHYERHRPDMAYDPVTYTSSPVDNASFVLVNLNARYKITKELSLFARIDNLFDKDYQTVYGYNQPSRGFFAGINWKM